MAATECPCAQCCGLRHAIRHALRKLDRWPYKTALRDDVARLQQTLRAQHPNPTPNREN